MRVLMQFLAVVLLGYSFVESTFEMCCVGFVEIFAYFMYV